MALWIGWHGFWFQIAHSAALWSKLFFLHWLLWKVTTALLLASGILGFVWPSIWHRGDKAFFPVVDKWVARAIMVGALASFVQYGRYFGVGICIADNTLPASNINAIVETAHVRKDLCGLSGTPQIPGMCSNIDLISWDEAEKQAARLVFNMTSAERHSLMSGIGWLETPLIQAVPRRGFYMGNTPPLPRLGIPALKMHDAGAGFRNNIWPLGAPGSSTCWISGLAMAASWDQNLVQRVATAIAREYRGKGANILLGPAVQVHRVARNGRNFEYMSGEDPHLGSVLAAAYVRGVQGQGVMACVKHWAFNEQETDRSTQSSDVDDRTAWELYYPPFEAAIRAGAASVMCSYNKVNGSWACENYDLLKRDLKEKMGFRGFVMSDWWAMHSASISKGLDQEMPGAPYNEGWKIPGNRFGAELTQGWILSHEKLTDIEQIDELGPPAGEDVASMKAQPHLDPVLRILAAAWRLRLFERPGCTPGAECVEAIMSSQTSAEHDEIAHEAASKAIVLLRNDGILPLRGTTSLAIIGETADAKSNWMYPDPYMGGGSGHCYTHKGRLVTPLRAISERANSEGVDVVRSATNNVHAAIVAARKAQVAVVIVSALAMEMYDRPTLSLDNNADELIMAVAQERPVIVLVQAPGAFLAPWRENVGAIAVQFMGGEATGQAWASLLFGDVSPSGRLPITLPVDESDTILPESSQIANYSEGLFTSYRAKSADKRSAYPFGHGLTYALFEYGVPEQLGDADCQAHVCIKVLVTNTAKDTMPSSEVAQAYVEFPPEAHEPKLVLKSFYRTAPLAADKSEEAIFNFSVRDLSAYQHGDWVLQDQITVHIGSSSTDIRTSSSIKVPPFRRDR